MKKCCLKCGEEFERPKDYSRKQWESRRFCSRSCAPRKPRKDILAKSTRYRKLAGGKGEHRAVMEAVLGRALSTTEYVHHINGDKLDNRPENLQVIDPVSHGRLHHLKHDLSKTCLKCGKLFSPHKTSRKKQQYCSHSCHMKARNGVPLWMGRAVARAVKEATSL